MKRLRSSELMLVVGFIFMMMVSSSPIVQANSFDESIRDKVQSTNQGFIGESMSVITNLGEGTAALAMAGALPDDEARYDSYKSLFVGGVSVTVLKYAIGKSRPPEPIEYKPWFSTSSASYRAFPSGHTTTAFALATTIANHYPDYKWYAYGMATLVGVSRLYTDAHWASDVAAGAGLGYASAKFVEYKW
ncbi:phosphatase PAP2 family protein [Natroniella sp. ANB-PHB2]|uniref:phosphatase PAP2 family protein n=1 Tax=Natroniella sp. ANB-PHB2 TaxID=3384444 RepID=UPI0038D36603